jgi:hypothetical protein
MDTNSINVTGIASIVLRELPRCGNATTIDEDSQTKVATPTRYEGRDLPCASGAGKNRSNDSGSHLAVEAHRSFIATAATLRLCPRLQVLNVV